MSEEDDLEDDDRENEGRFPLSVIDKPKIEKVVELVRDNLSSMSPADLRAAASILLALERLPLTTPGVQVTFGFVQPNTDGNFGWADIEISENEFRLGTGEHFHDPAVGGDTESRTVFEMQAGGSRRSATARCAKPSRIRASVWSRSNRGGRLRSRWRRAWTCFKGSDKNTGRLY